MKAKRIHQRKNCFTRTVESIQEEQICYFVECHVSKQNSEQRKICLCTFKANSLSPLWKEGGEIQTLGNISKPFLVTFKCQEEEQARNSLYQLGVVPPVCDPAASREFETEGRRLPSQCTICGETLSQND